MRELAQDIQRISTLLLTDLLWECWISGSFCEPRSTRPPPVLPERGGAPVDFPSPWREPQMRCAPRSRRFLFATIAATALLGGGIAAAAPSGAESGDSSTQSASDS